MLAALVGLPALAQPLAAQSLILDDGTAENSIGVTLLK